MRASVHWAPLAVQITETTDFVFCKRCSGRGSDLLCPEDLFKGVGMGSSRKIKGGLGLDPGVGSVLVQQALNAVPITRTPWGGSLILTTKLPAVEALAACDPKVHDKVKTGRVGESWEISTGNPYPSRLRDPFGSFVAGTALQDVVAAEPWLLGSSVIDRVGAHSPLLLKWLHAQEVLSLQVHPARGDWRLRPDQEGKPESWLVMAVEPGGALYLGFREGVSRHDAAEALATGREREVLNRFVPRVGDYICVPPGCVHAIDAGVLLAEPQFVMPGREGVTLRVSDWGRRYNERGERDAQGKPRETHVEQALDTIDWDLPGGAALLRQLCRPLSHGEPYHPGAQTPFPVVAYFNETRSTYTPLVDGAYSVATVWKGRMELSTNQGLVVMNQGESAFITHGHGDPRQVPSSLYPSGIPFELCASDDGGCGAAFFSIDLSVC